MSRTYKDVRFEFATNSYKQERRNTKQIRIKKLNKNRKTQKKNAISFELQMA